MGSGWRPPWGRGALGLLGRFLPPAAAVPWGCTQEVVQAGERPQVRQPARGRWGRRKRGRAGPTVPPSCTGECLGSPTAPPGLIVPKTRPCGAGGARCQGGCSQLGARPGWSVAWGGGWQSPKLQGGDPGGFLEQLGKGWRVPGLLVAAGWEGLGRVWGARDRLCPPSYGWGSCLSATVGAGGCLLCLAGSQGCGVHGPPARLLAGETWLGTPPGLFWGGAHNGELLAPHKLLSKRK